MGSACRVFRQTPHFNSVHINFTTMCSRPVPVAMEASPEVVNNLLEGLNVEGVKAHDLINTEDETLASLPGGRVLGLLLTLPKETVQGQEETQDLYVIKNEMNTICGTSAVIHVIANKMLKTMEEIDPTAGELAGFLYSSMNESPEDRGRRLGDSYNIINLHKKVANEGHSLPIEGDARHNTVALIEKDGSSYMIDGQTGKAFKLEGGLLAAARAYIQSGGDSVDYSLLALMGPLTLEQQLAAAAANFPGPDIAALGPCPE